jgi:hypothetical protein
VLCYKFGTLPILIRRLIAPILQTAGQTTERDSLWVPDFGSNNQGSN